MSVDLVKNPISLHYNSAFIGGKIKINVSLSYARVSCRKLLWSRMEKFTLKTVTSLGQPFRLVNLMKDFIT